MLKDKVSPRFYKAYLAVASCVAVFLLIVGFASAIREYRISTAKYDPYNVSSMFHSDKPEKGHPIYAYSVVPGGVWNLAAYNAALSDPVVRKHYAEVGKPVALTSFDNDQYLYDSYRVRNVVFWTSYKVKIPAGEKVWLTENGGLIRLRCGNRLSFTPMKPVIPTKFYDNLVTMEPFPQMLNEVLPSVNSAQNLSPMQDSKILPYDASRLGNLLPQGKTTTPKIYSSPSPFGASSIVPTSFIYPYEAIPDDVVTPRPPIAVTSVPEPSYLPAFGLILLILILFGVSAK